MELEQDHYDVVVIGTGLAESITAASLANSGKSVLHLDPIEYYGASQASLTLDELVSWAEARKGSSSDTAAATVVAGPSSSSSSSSTYLQHQRQTYSHLSTSPSPLTPNLQTARRQYSLSLYPALLPSRGALIQTLIDSGVSKYVGFRLLDGVSVWDDEGFSSGYTSIGGPGGAEAPVGGAAASKGKARRVPGSKEDVFKDKSVSLVDKRRLMRFLMFVAGDFESDDLLKGKEQDTILSFLTSTFSLPPTLAERILYAISHCQSPNEHTLPVLKRTRRYLKCIGRYGPSAFLIGQYGGAGEIAQGFCRACAVKGGTYVLGDQAVPTSLRILEEKGVEESADKRMQIELPCHPRPITASYLITTPDHVPDSLLSLPGTYISTGTGSESSISEGRLRSVTARGIAILPSLPPSLRRSSAKDNDDGAEERVAEEEDGSAQQQDDTAVVLFPPEEPEEGGDAGVGLVKALIMGEGTGSCPSGQYIAYLSTELPPPITNESLTTTKDPAEVLRPYLSRLHDTPSFEAYYLEERLAQGSSPIRSSGTGRAEASPLIVLEPYRGLGLLTDGLDWEAEEGRKAWGEVMRERGQDGEEDGEGRGWWEGMGEQQDGEEML